MKTVLIEIYLSNNLEKSDLEFRQIITGTIEERGLGEVVEETSASNMLEIVIEVEENKEITEDLEGLLLSLGFTNFKIQDIFIDEE
ncbi:hypothetical protein [Flavobacterium aquidurense]|uniref:Uncharacterized protein n=1 Tax=Flavobacterium aquidurense TaxID=362413 RepID=A0A0N8VN48_9FLAO|nr:hypothetical protein [Flavobacterium aquidurense]KQB41124.1 hypothetical protein RC62_4499 [Flavobacterium aquidurense]